VATLTRLSPGPTRGEGTSCVPGVGRLSVGQTRHLFAAAESVPDAYPDAEERLVDIVDGLSVSDTAKAVAYWRQAVDDPGELDRQTEL
jgi:hypothetical protein